MPTRRAHILYFSAIIPSLLIAIPVPGVTPSYISELTTAPTTPGPKRVLARDSRQRQALMTLLDVLGLTTDEVPLAVGAYFGVFHASTLMTGGRRWARP